MTCITTLEVMIIDFRISAVRAMKNEHLLINALQAQFGDALHVCEALLSFSIDILQICIDLNEIMLRNDLKWQIPYMS